MKVAIVLGNHVRHGYPPIGVLSIASNLIKQIPDCDVQVYDVFPPHDDLLREAFDIIGFSCMTIQYPDVYEYAQVIRSRYSGIIIVGGVHITLTHALPPWANYGIIGEGEITFTDLALHIQDMADCSCIPGVICRKNGKIHIAPKREPLINLDELPFPAWDLVDMEYYLKPNNVYGTVVERGISLITSRGCIYHCEYCASSKIWETIRFHSAEYVVDMIEYVTRTYKLQHIWFADDHFALKKDRLSQICHLLEDKRIRISAGINCRVESYDAEMSALLKRIGVRAIAVGLETGSDRMRKAIKHNSKLTVEEEARIVEQLAADGFEVHGMFMINLPGETEEDLQMTRDLIFRLPLAKCSTAIATPYYGTRWWDIALSQGIVSDNPFDFRFMRSYDMKTLDEERPIFRTEISRDTLRRYYHEISDYSAKLFSFDWKNR